MAKFPPTSEQQVITDLFLTGKSLKIEAFAGTGKTSTLTLLAEAAPQKRIVYVAFNKPIVVEAQGKFPRNVKCSTAHSLAYKAVMTPARTTRLRSAQRMRSTDIAYALGIDALVVERGDGSSKRFTAAALASVTMQTVEQFCKTGDDIPLMAHVPEIDHDETAQLKVAAYVMPAVKRAWADLIAESGSLPFDHSHYLKIWQLSKPKIAADVILFDEAQDANPVMVSVIAAQKHAQLVWVGDSQQQIYTFTGAINALQTMPAENVAYLTQSFRFGPAVAQVANGCLAELGVTRPVRGFEQVPSTVGYVSDPQAVLCRTNVGAVREVLEAQEIGRKAHLVGGGGEIVRFVKAAAELMEGFRTDHPELATFESWQEVLDYVEEDELGAGLKVLVKLVTEFSAPTIIEAFRVKIEEEDADLIVSTAHKSKGREWDRVRLAGDFRDDLNDEDEEGNPKVSDPAEEWRLLYVAATRARLALDVTQVVLLAELVGYQAPEAPVEPEVAPEPEVAAPVTNGHIGERVELTLRVTKVLAPRQKGDYEQHITTLVDDSGHTYKWFGSYRLDEGRVYTGEWAIKSHGEFRGVPETVISHPAGVKQEVEA